MAYIDISKLSDSEKAKLVDNRWTSSSSVWDVIDKVYRQNVAIYENKPEWTSQIPERRRNQIVLSNRIFPNMESVINSLIANPPGINILPGRAGVEFQDFASKLENYFRKKYADRNIKEVLRMGLRNLYFSRLLVVKAFWNTKLANGGDFDYKALDPRKVRMGKYARKENDSEFVIEEISDNLCSVVERFPEKKQELMGKYGFYGEKGEQEMYIKNPDITYKEAWIDDYVIFKHDNIILGTIKNPYWDNDGILITEEESQSISQAESPQRQREILSDIKLSQAQRKQEMEAQEQSQPGEQQEYAQQPNNPNYKQYFYNYFDAPRKPYIFATIFNNENSPIGRTDMITLSASLQQNINIRKMDIAENCEMVNGWLKVDSSVMGKSDAQRLRFETKGILWGKGVAQGVIRETGTPLPAMVYQDLQDSRNEIDNIMAASSAFRGEREGQETKAGRLALIQQSFLRLNELVQVVEYVSKEIFDWGMQLAKTRYTEYHYAKWMGNESAQEIIELIQDDFETGSEVVIIPGKTLPVDDEFKFEQAQNDFDKGALSLPDYLRISKYDNHKELAKNAVAFKVNPVVQVGISPEEAQQLQPPQTEEKAPNVSISYADLPPDAQVQLLEKIGIQANPEIILAEKLSAHNTKQAELQMKKGNAELKLST